MTATRQEVSSGVLWSLVRTWGSRLVGFIIYFQLARLLSPSDMGLFAASFAVLALLEILVDLGLVQAIVRQRQLTNAQLNAVFVVNMALAVTLLVLLASVSGFLEGWLKAPGLQSVVLISSLGLIFTALGMCQEALARKALDFRLMATRTLLATGISGLIGVALAYLNYGVWALVWQFVLAGIINTGTMWFRPRWKPSREIDFRGLDNMLHFGLGMLGQRLISFADSRGVDIIVGALYGPAGLGIFAVGTKLQYICTQLFGTAFVDVAFPAFARIQNDFSKLRTANITALRMLAIVSMPLWCILASTAPESIEVAFGHQWSSSAPILSVFAWIGFVQTITLFDTPLLNAAGHSYLNVLLSLAKAVLVLCAVAFVGRDGTIQDAAWAIFFTQIIATCLYIFTVNRALKLSVLDKAKAIWPAVCGSALAFITIGYCRSANLGVEWNAFARLLVYAAIGTTVYVIALACTARDILRRALAQVQRHK